MGRIGMCRSIDAFVFNIYINFGWVKILAFLLNYHWSYMYIL